MYSVGMKFDCSNAVIVMVKDVLMFGFSSDSHVTFTSCCEVSAAILTLLGEIGGPV